jgi:hypothetical protein
MRLYSCAFSALLLLALNCSSESNTSTQPPELTREAGPKPDDAGATADAGALSGVLVTFGDDVSEAVRNRVTAHLTAVSPNLRTISKTEAPTLAAAALLLSFGDTEASKRVIGETETFAAEGYALRSKALGQGTVLAGRGAARANSPYGNLGTHHAAYAMLEQLGFGFLHPLKPSVPKALASVPQNIDVRETPKWEERTMHLHTMHPLELTDFLQGWGPGGTDDRAGFMGQMGEWDSFLEWCVANGQNAVEWLLLRAESWAEFADSQERMSRERIIVEHAHTFGIAAGIDVPIALKQQHPYRLITKTGTLEEELAELGKNVAFVMSGKFDFIGTETGTSEFTHPEGARMLAWMNELTRLAEDVYKVHAYIKVHTSTGQVADGYPDPKTGKPINFNFLPHFADKRLGILAHTVQHYGLTDPAPTYGNKDFSGIRDFLHQETPIRPAYFYPETAYWVSFDIDVPLFLPLYGQRRSADLRLLAIDERDKRAGSTGKPMNGQFIFSSGWEWGYWLSDVVAARAAWNPHAEATSDSDAYKAVLQGALRAFGSLAAPLESWIARYSDAEYRYLIKGEVNGKAPADVSQRNGQAYLQGWETWDDVSKTTENLPVKLPPTQPDKLGLIDMRNPLHGGPSYTREIKPLFVEMERAFTALQSEIEALVPQANDATKDLVVEMADAAKMTLLRLRQVHGLYDYSDDFLSPVGQAARRARLVEARRALDDAAAIVKVREKSYRVPADRIAGWRKNPTAYSYGYLWSVRSLHYFWRDEGKAVDAPLFPCYMNIVNPVDVANGEGFGTDAARLFGGVLGGEQSRGCLAEPKSEPQYPQDNLRARP